MTVLRGVAHARALGLAAVATAVVWIALTLGWETQFAVEVRFPQQGRGVGAFEIAAVLLSSLLPPLTPSRYGAVEFLAAPGSRALNAAVSAGLTLVPLTCMPVWLLSAEGRDPFEVDYPSGAGYAGTLWLFAALGQLLFYAGGTLVCLLGTPALWYAVVCAQQAFPTAPFLRDLASGLHWQTGPTVTVVAAVIAVAVAWFGHSIPRSAR